MWVKATRIVLGFPLKYVSGFLFAMGGCAAAVVLSDVLLSGLPGGARIGFIIATAIFVGIPTGSALGISLLDRFVLRQTVRMRQLIAGALAGASASVFLAVLDSYGVSVFHRLPHDTSDSALGGFGLFYIVGVLAALLAHTLVGMVGCSQAEKKANGAVRPELRQSAEQISRTGSKPARQRAPGYMWWRIAGVILGLPLEYVAGFTLAVISCFAVTALIGPDMAVFVGIPVGAALGIMVLDRFVFMRPFLKRQLFSAIILSVATSIFLTILDRHGIRVHERISWDGPASMLFGYGVFYIIDVLAALLAYTIAGLMKPKTTNVITSHEQHRRNANESDVS